jgi:hypothetical protein
VVNLWDEKIGYWQRRWCKKLPRQIIKLALKPKSTFRSATMNQRDPEAEMGVGRLYVKALVYLRKYSTTVLRHCCKPN